MAGKYNTNLNAMLVNLFNHVMAVEAQAVITDEFKDMTNNDMHIIEAIGVGEVRNMSEIAKRLKVTMGTLTTNMNGLEKKGYVVRKRSSEDKRVVLITLTGRGRKAFFHHRNFHKDMIRLVVKELDDSERRILYSCLRKLDEFFDSTFQEIGNK